MRVLTSEIGCYIQANAAGLSKEVQKGIAAMQGFAAHTTDITAVDAFGRPVWLHLDPIPAIKIIKPAKRNIFSDWKPSCEQ